MIIEGGTMLILIPWKPVVIVWGLLSAMILFGYIAGSLMKGQNPFAVYSAPTQHIVGKPPAPRTVPKQTHTHAATPKGSA
jgi:hypothetical protein